MPLLIAPLTYCFVHQDGGTYGDVEGIEAT